MSIVDLIEARVTEGELIRLTPVLKGDPVKRLIYVTTDIYEYLDGAWGDEADERRAGRLRGDLERFIKGEVVSLAFAMPYNHPKTTYLSRLDPVEDEIWEIRSIDPQPSIRVFGRFACPDLLVLTNFALRKNLGGPRSREFRDEMVRCATEWKRLFHTYPPYKGDTGHDYVREKVYIHDGN